AIVGLAAIWPGLFLGVHHDLPSAALPNVFLEIFVTHGTEVRWASCGLRAWNSRYSATFGLVKTNICECIISAWVKAKRFIPITHDVLKLLEFLFLHGFAVAERSGQRYESLFLIFINGTT